MVRGDRGEEKQQRRGETVKRGGKVSEKIWSLTERERKEEKKGLQIQRKIT